MRPLNENPRISDLRLVKAYFVGENSPTTYIIHHEEVDTFVAATRKLHFNPGVNPHNGGKTTVVWHIEVCAITPTGPFWWTTTDLQNNNDPNGATVYEDYSREQVFTLCNSDGSPLKEGMN
jgi:hypothetical protein